MNVKSLLIATSKLAGLVITQFNADRDAGGKFSHRFFDGVAKVPGEKDH